MSICFSIKKNSWEGSGQQGLASTPMETATPGRSHQCRVASAADRARAASPVASSKKPDGFKQGRADRRRRQRPPPRPSGRPRSAWASSAACQIATRCSAAKLRAVSVREPRPMSGIGGAIAAARRARLGSQPSSSSRPITRTGAGRTSTDRLGRGPSRPFCRSSRRRRGDDEFRTAVDQRGEDVEDRGWPRRVHTAPPSRAVARANGTSQRLDRAPAPKWVAARRRARCSAGGHSATALLRPPITAAWPISGAHPAHLELARRAHRGPLVGADDADEVGDPHHAARRADGRPRTRRPSTFAPPPAAAARGCSMPGSTGRARRRAGR